jgi:hypothetical protein
MTPSRLKAFHLDGASILTNASASHKWRKRQEIYFVLLKLTS